jgi:tripartite-type tricarboxylate transporter receptor subunit TctC
LARNVTATSPASARRESLTRWRASLAAALAGNCSLPAAAASAQEQSPQDHLRRAILLALADTGPAHESIAGGRLRALAVTSPLRLASLPNVPTMAEIGLPDLEVQYWVGLFAPAGTPQPVLRKLEAEMMRIATLPEIANRMVSIQVSPVGSSSEDFAKVLASDLARWSAVAKTADIKPND